MKNKLISLFKTLVAQELRDLSRFVRSPFHNQRADVIALFDILRKAKLEHLTEESLFAQVFPNDAFNKKKLATVMYELMKIIEAYFAIQVLQKEPIRQQFYMAKVALEHGQENIFQSKIKKAKDLLAKQGLDNLETRYLQYQIEMEVYNQKKNRRGDPSVNLEQPSENLDVFLMGSKLRQACLLLSHEKTTKIEYDYDLLHQILKHLESPAQQHLLREPLIALYYFSYKALKEEKAIYFEQLKNLLEAHQTCFTQVELKDFYVIGINFFIKQLNDGQDQYLSAAFEWYRKALEEGVLLEQGVLSGVYYRHMVALGLRLKEFDWVKDFIFKYRSFLNPKQRKLHFTDNLAKWHYEKGELEKAMDLVRPAKYVDSLSNLTSKILLMKIYYDLEERDVLDSYLKSFEHTVRRQRKSGYHKEHYLQMIAVMSKLLKVNFYDKAAVHQLEDLVLGIDRLLEKKWFLERIRRLKR